VHFLLSHSVKLRLNRPVKPARVCGESSLGRRSAAALRQILKPRACSIRIDSGFRRCLVQRYSGPGAGLAIPVNSSSQALSQIRPHRRGGISRPQARLSVSDHAIPGRGVPQDSNRRPCHDATRTAARFRRIPGLVQPPQKAPNRISMQGTTPLEGAFIVTRVSGRVYKYS